MDGRVSCVNFVEYDITLYSIRISDSFEKIENKRINRMNYNPFVFHFTFG